MNDEIQYALSKQINRINSIHTDYGDLPLEQDDIDAVAELLRGRFEKRLKALTQDKGVGEGEDV